MQWLPPKESICQSLRNAVSLLLRTGIHFPMTLYDIPPSHRRCMHDRSLTHMIQLRGLALKYISILEYISIPKGNRGNIDYK